MDTHVYKDKQGNVIQAVASSILGLTVVPAGMTIEDAHHITQDEFQAIIKSHPPVIAGPSLADLELKVASLTTLVQSLTKKL